MKKFYLVLILSFVAVQGAIAQSQPATAKQYFFKTKINVELENMAGATTLLGPVRAVDQASAETPISFPFQFVSKTFNSFQVFSSGALLLLPNTLGQGFQIITPWSEGGFVTGDDGHISYKIIGTTNRKLVVEYYLADFVASSSFSAIANNKFQVWMFENSNQIQFVYGDGKVIKYQPVVGISGNDATGDFLQVNTTLHQITDDSYYVSSTWPGSGRSYLFSPFAFTAVDPEAVISALTPTSVCEGGSALLTVQLNDAEPTGYQWLKDGLPVTGAINNTFSAAVTGKYTVQVTYAGGTITSADINVFVAALQANVSNTNITCNANSNGSITVANASGGNNIYEYSINNGPLQTSEIFSGLDAGVYTVQLHSGACSQFLGSYAVRDTRISPVVSIVPGVSACANVTLTANPSNALSYNWSNAETGKSITLGNSNADGNYTVTVSNGVGCTGSATYNYNKQNQLNSYVILASKAVSIGESNIVNGAIGNKGTLPVYINKNTTVNAFIKSLNIKLNEPVTVSGAISYESPTVVLPNVYSNTSFTNDLPSYTVPDNFVGTINGNFLKLVIGKKSVVTVTGTIFKTITIKAGAQVTFSSGDVSIDFLETEDGIKGTNTAFYTSVSFAPSSIIRIKDKLMIGKRNRVNAGGSTFYMADVRKDEEKVSIDGLGTEFNGNIYIPVGKLTVRDAEQWAPCIMTGIFICQNVVSEKYITWNKNICNVFAPRVAVAVQNAPPKTFTISAYPNPAIGKFNLMIKTPVTTNAELTITNMNGAIIKKDSYKNVTSGRTLAVDLTGKPAGNYLVKITTSLGVQTLKVLVK